jgi:hypothetical protein
MSNITRPLFQNLVFLVESAQTPIVIAGLGRDDLEVGDFRLLSNIFDGIFWNTGKSESSALCYPNWRVERKGSKYLPRHHCCSLAASI